MLKSTFFGRRREGEEGGGSNLKVAKSQRNADNHSWPKRFALRSSLSGNSLFAPTSMDIDIVEG